MCLYYELKRIAAHLSEDTCERSRHKLSSLLKKCGIYQNNPSKSVTHVIHMKEACLPIMAVFVHSRILLRKEE